MFLDLSSDDLFQGTLKKMLFTYFIYCMLTAKRSMYIRNSALLSTYIFQPISTAIKKSLFVKNSAKLRQ